MDLGFLAELSLPRAQSRTSTGMSAFDHLPPELQELRPIKVLRRSLEGGRLSHAILLHGDNMDTIESVALAIAADLLKVDNPRKHPDLFTLRPAKRARRIRISGTGGAVEPNTMRWLLRELQQTSNQGGDKVAVIYEADRMMAESANAFLKTLEEPPAQTTLLLLTTFPYDLMDTIRSRCFQFRIPSLRVSIEHPHWVSWLDDYRTWIQALLEAPTRRPEEAAQRLFATYGLVSRFQGVLETLAGEAWKIEKELAPDYLDDDELSALEVGVRRGTRTRMLADLERATRDYCVQEATADPAAAQALAKVVQNVERMVGLLEINLREDAALEGILLASLRAWSEAGRQR